MSKPRRFRSRPQEIEAVQWDGSLASRTDVEFLFGTKIRRAGDGFGLQLRAGKDGAQRGVPVPVGHWIVRLPGGDNSDVWPVAPEYFAAKYFDVDEETGKGYGLADDPLDWRFGRG